MRIPMHVEQSLGISRPDEPVLCGVPVPRGELTETGWMFLHHANGDRWPVHTSPAAYWPDGSVKWLHVCGRLSLDEGASHDLSLDTVGIDHADTPSLKVEERDDGVVVTGGPIEVTLGPEIDGWLNARPAAGAPGASVTGLSPELDFVGPEPETPPRAGCFVIADGPTRVVSRSPNRVVLRSNGHWLDEAGEPMAELRLFVEVRADMAEVRLQPALIYLGQAQRDLLRRFELVVRSGMGATLSSMEDIAPLTDTKTYLTGDGPADPRPIDRITYGFGAEQGRGYWDRVRPYVHLARFPQARQVQIGSSFYRTEKRVLPDGCSWVKANEGRRAQGWCHLNQDGTGLTAAMRYYWQEYPSSLAVDAEQGTLTFGFWPAAAEPLDLRRYSPMRYGPDAYEYGTGFFPEETHGAHGVAKARELVLQFHDGPADSREQRWAVARRALSFTRPLRPMATGAHFAATEVVGQVGAIDSRSGEDVAKRISEVIHLLASERDRRGWYGMVDFGDILMGYYTALERWAFDDGGYGWINTEHLPDYGLWLCALASRRDDWLKLAIEMSRHNRDLDTYHAGNFIGSGTRHNVNHWGCADKEWRVSNPISRRLHFYTTADPWTAEVIGTTVEMYQSYERTCTLAPSMSAALSGVLTKWEMSGREEDGEVVRKMADVYARAFMESGTFLNEMHVNIATGEGHPIEGKEAGAYFFFETFGAQHTLCELALLLEHKELADALTRYARFRAEPGRDGRQPGTGPLPACALAYRITGDPEFRKRVRGSLEEAGQDLHTTGGDGLQEEPIHMAPVECVRRNKFACRLAQILLVAPVALAALQETDT
ncbi:MAG: hypothetical protein ACLFWL_17185 [Candidatus Brocadiia bacterium]